MLKVPEMPRDPREECSEGGPERLLMALGVHLSKHTAGSETKYTQSSDTEQYLLAGRNPQDLVPGTE